jgi:hypothetical protein
VISLPVILLAASLVLLLAMVSSMAALAVQTRRADEQPSDAL